jgi:hypothetical protein
MWAHFKKSRPKKQHLAVGAARVITILLLVVAP